MAFHESSNECRRLSHSSFHFFEIKNGFVAGAEFHIVEK
jgi:hypothetical protein